MLSKDPVCIYTGKLCISTGIVAEWCNGCVTHKLTNPRNFLRFHGSPKWGRKITPQDPMVHHYFPQLMAIWLVVYLPLWKIWKSIGMIIPNLWKNVPNHQPATVIEGSTGTWKRCGFDRVTTYNLRWHLGMDLLMKKWGLNQWIMG